MEIKKSPKADLENKRSMFVLIGFVLVFALLYIGLEWTQTEISKIEVTTSFLDDGEQEMVAQNTMHDNTPPPEVAPPPPATVVQEVLNIVENNIETTATIISPEETNSEPIVIPPPVVVTGPTHLEEEIEEIFTIVEDPPSFPGGDKARVEFINKTIKYPTIAQENGIQGTVYVAFVVNRDGRIVDVQVVRGVDSSLDKEAVRVIEAMPPWNPGKQRGQPVRTRFTLPIRFTLK